ncbi:hypothetical protein CDAR_528761 [Caerostris darwini]|uniref:Uncharacterized protein n=1 Tax=Caerostris darwini TaxID=1538125 RepID=A0AAV4UNN8_9ARAC|nr:hypothetical protein CDAR_528761 [Caerostris darwini]
MNNRPINSQIALMKENPMASAEGDWRGYHLDLLTRSKSLRGEIHGMRNGFLRDWFRLEVPGSHWIVIDDGKLSVVIYKFKGRVSGNRMLEIWISDPGGCWWKECDE